MPDPTPAAPATLTADVIRDIVKSTFNPEMLRDLVKELVGVAVADAMKDSQAKGREMADQRPGEYLRALLSDSSARPGTAPAPGDTRGYTIARVARALVLGRNDLQASKRFAEQLYKGDKPTLDGVMSVIDSGTPTAGGIEFKAMASNTFASGGALVPGAFVNEVIELLRPRAAFRAANPTPIPLDRGTVTIPRLAGGATATWVGEGAAITSTEQTTDNVALMARKLAAITPVNSELLQFADVNVDRMIRDDLIAAIAQKEDITFLTGDGLNNTPKGMRYWAASGNVRTSAETNSLAGAITFGTAMMTLLADGYSRMLRPSWFFSVAQRLAFLTYQFTNGPWAFRDEIVGGTFFGIPYQLVNDTAWPTAANGTKNAALADMADMLLGSASTITLESSNAASYYNSSGAVVPAFAHDQTVIRIIEQVDVGCRHRGSVAWSTNAPFAP